METIWKTSEIRSHLKKISEYNFMNISCRTEILVLFSRRFIYWGKCSNFVNSAIFAKYSAHCEKVLNKNLLKKNIFYAMKRRTSILFLVTFFKTDQKNRVRIFIYKNSYWKLDLKKLRSMCIFFKKSGM